MIELVPLRDSIRDSQPQRERWTTITEGLTVWQCRSARGRAQRGSIRGSHLDSIRAGYSTIVGLSRTLVLETKKNLEGQNEGVEVCVGSAKNPPSPNME